MENDATYSYHPHLGSASWITDHTGQPVQHLRYLPYGEPFINQRLSGYNERFTFTSKERDEETGYGYFGARYMDHELTTMWLSVDPMSDKYPSLSPYAYCAWNPVKLVDPDGRDWYIPEGQVTPVFDKNVTAKNCPEGAMYIGKTAGWSGLTEADMGKRYYGDADGNLTVKEFSVNVTTERFPSQKKQSKPSLGERITRFENNVSNWASSDFGVSVAQFEEKLVEKMKPYCMALASAMPIVSQVNSIAILATGEDIYGDQATGLDKFLSVAGFTGKGMGLINSKIMKKTGKFSDHGSTTAGVVTKTFPSVFGKNKKDGKK